MSAQTPFWFTETELPFGKDGVRIQVEVTEVLHDETSPYGHIQIFNTPFYGKMLVIDGIIQTTESDEFIYHEMMVTLPALQHGAPEKILIIGGGDGGALRQATRLPSLKGAVQVEIDDLVANVSRTHLPTISAGAFDDPRVEVIYTDGAEFVKTCQETFDIIVLDLTDPIPDGPAEQLFGEDFLRQVKKLLTPNGILSMQCGSLIFQPNEVKLQLQRFKQLFTSARLHSAVVPGYQLTTFGFLLGSDAPLAQLDSAEFERRLQALSGSQQYLSFDVYQASAAIPPYLQDQIL